MDKRSVQSVIEENENASLAADVSPPSKLTHCKVASYLKSFKNCLLRLIRLVVCQNNVRYLLQG